MNRKKYSCEICNYEVDIRSTIKTGDYAGKKTCQICKHKFEAEGALVVTSKMRTRPFKKSKEELPSHHLRNYKVNKIRKSNPKTAAKRKKEREGYPEFFRIAIEALKKSPTCQNCGEAINVDYNPSWNIAHILPKSKYKSVATHPDNYLFLCAAKDNKNSCHEKFDGPPSKMVKMKCFHLAKNKFESFKGKVLERGKIFYIFDEN